MNKMKPDQRMTLVTLAVAVVLGVALIVTAGAFQSDLEAWIKQDVRGRLRLVIGVLTLLTAGPAFGIAGFLANLGRRIVRAERYPPPGLRILGDAPGVIGEAAVRRGRVFQMLAVVLGVAGVLLTLLLWRLVFLFEHGAA